MPSLLHLALIAALVQWIGPSFVKPTPANLSVPLSALNVVQLQHLKETQPDCMINVQMSAPTAVQLLAKSSVLHNGRPEADAHHPAAAGSVPEDSSPALAAKLGAGAQAPHVLRRRGCTC